MDSGTRTSTVEIANVTPALRRDLRFSLHEHGRQPCYLVEDEKNSEFYRIGIPEYIFISLLDGTTTVREAMGHTASLLGAQAFTERDAAAVCKWLVESQLAQTESSSDAESLLGAARHRSRLRLARWLNPLVLRLPLVRPDALVEWSTARFGWWFSYPFFGVWAVTVLFALQQLCSSWGQLRDAATNVLASSNLVWIALTWGALKILHEMSHAVACKKLGGHVREAGVVLILFAPIPYVDVTSSWRLSSKWKRILISAAGMYTELFVAALATVVWVHTPPGVLHQQAYNIVLTASLVTVLFNANPLMRFDGYYMLSDFVEIPNLYGLGQQYMRYLGRRYVLGLQARMPTWRLPQKLMVATYGLLALMWRILVCGGILLVASTLFHGAGMILALLGIAMWLGIPLFQFARYLWKGNHIERPSLWRFSITASVSALIVSMLLWLPEPGGVRAPAVVAYDPLHVIRAPHAGFLQSIHVAAGADVTQGTLLAVMDHRELRAEAEELRLEIEQSRQRRRIYGDDGDIAALQAETEMCAALEEELAERREQLEGSVIKSPAAGTLLGRDLPALVGTYVVEGQELFAIGQQEQKRLELSIAQEDVSFFHRAVGQAVDVCLHTPGSERILCRLRSVDPRGSKDVANSVFSVAHGGPLPVVRIADETPHTQKTWEFVEPRFKGDIRLARRQSQQLRAGQMATVRLSHARGTLGQLIYRQTRDWIDARLAAARRD